MAPAQVLCTATSNLADNTKALDSLSWASSRVRPDQTVSLMPKPAVRLSRGGMLVVDMWKAHSSMITRSAGVCRCMFIFAVRYTVPMACWGNTA